MMLCGWALILVLVGNAIFYTQRYRASASFFWLFMALFVLIGWAILFYRGVNDRNPPMLSTPYPEASAAILLIAFLWLAFSVYRYFRRRAQWLATKREEQL
jgi:hypothetical protein